MKEAVADEFALREFLLGLLVGAALVGVVCVLVLAVLRRGASGGRPAAAPAASVAHAQPVQPVPPPVQPVPPVLPLRDPERVGLVDGLADLALRLPPGLDREAVDLLARAGVARRSADGLRFDPTWQDAIGSEPVADPAADGTVLRTVRDFFDDHGRPATRPQVVVAVLRAPGPPAQPGPGGGPA